MRVDIPIGLKLCSKPVSCAAVEDDCAGGLVIEVFDDSDKVDADVGLLHGCIQSFLREGGGTTRGLVIIMPKLKDFTRKKCPRKLKRKFYDSYQRRKMHPLSSFDTARVNKSIMCMN